MNKTYDWDEFERVVYHEFGHLLANFINRKYYCFPKIVDIKISPLYDELHDKMSFTGVVKVKNNFDENAPRKEICLHIMAIISGCMFQSCYFRFIKPTKSKGFDECFCH